MNRYLILLLLGITSCVEQQKKMEYSFWKVNAKITSDVKFKMETSDGVVDGYCWHYYKNGQLLSKVRYEDNKLMDIYEVYDSLGNKLNYGNFKNGNGYAISYDDKKGTRTFAGNYQDGLRTGWWKNYNFRGELTDSIFFDSGMNEDYDFYSYVLY